MMANESLVSLRGPFYSKWANYTPLWLVRGSDGIIRTVFEGQSTGIMHPTKRDALAYLRENEFFERTK